MEIKIRKRISTITPGVEHWVKYKLGKGDLRLYESEINELLHENQLNPDIELFQHNLMCEVTKKRRGGVVLGIGFEFTELKLKFPSNYNYSIGRRDNDQYRSNSLVKKKDDIVLLLLIKSCDK